MYLLQLLASNVPLAALLGMLTAAQLQAVEGIATTLKATPTVFETPVVPSGSKCWQQFSEQSLPTPRFHQQKRRRPLKSALTKDLDLKKKAGGRLSLRNSAWSEWPARPFKNHAPLTSDRGSLMIPPLCSAKWCLLPTS